MNTIKSTVLLIISSILVGMTFTACSADNPISEKAPQASNSIYPISDVHVMEKGYFKFEIKSGAITSNEGSQLKPEDFDYTALSEAEIKYLAERQLANGGTSDFYLYAWNAILPLQDR